MPQTRMTDKQKQLVKELYQAYFTAKEVSHVMPFSYATIQGLYRGFEQAKVIKHDRFNLTYLKTSDKPL